MPTRIEEAIVKLENLSLAKLLDFLDALSGGDLEAAAKHGGVKRSQLADLQPSGESGKLLDVLEQRALFLLYRKTGLVVMRGLLVAADVLREIAQGPASIGEAEAYLDEHDKPLPMPGLDRHEEERRARAAMTAIAQTKIPSPKNLEQKRIAALGLLDLAQKLELFTLAKAYRAPDIEADEEETLARMAEEQGLGDLSGHGDKPERLLRSVPFAS